MIIFDTQIISWLSLIACLNYLQYYYFLFDYNKRKRFS